MQPLAGEVAARRSFFDQLPFATGYAIETSMLLHARDLLGGTDGMAQVDLEERHNRHQPLRALGPMAYAVLRVILERLRAEGRLVDDHAPPLQTADGQLIQVELSSARRMPRCALAPVTIRCVYTDLDGTLLGRGASLFRTAEGDFTLLAARALEACHRAGAEVVIKSGRRRAQVMEDARLLGQTSYIFEVGSGLVIDGELTFLTGDLQPPEDRTIHAQIEAAGAPGAAARALRRAARAPRALARRTARSRTCSAARSTPPRPTSCWPPRDTTACGWSTTARSRTGATPTT